MLISDVRTAIRSLRRSPLFTAVAVMSLGIALALNTTMFGIVDAILHPPMPHAGPERLYTIRFSGDDPRRVVPPDVKIAAVRDGLPGIDGFALITWRSAQIVGGGEAMHDLVSMVTPDFFAVAGVGPVVGRTFGPGAAGRTEAVIDFALWRRFFDAQPLERGLTVEVDEQPFTVVGVMPPGMRLGIGGVWVPMGSLQASSRTLAEPQMVLRMSASVDRARLAADLAVVSRRLQAEHGSPGYPLAARLRNVEDESAPHLGEFYKLLVVLVAGVLAIASANLATLLLARGAARRRADAIRLALGATRASVARAVMAECSLVALAGATVGVVLAYWGMALIAHVAPRHMAQLGEFLPAVSVRVFLFAFGTALVVMLLAGVLPALRASRVPAAEPLKDGAGTTRRRRERYSALIVAEVALSTALLMLTSLATMATWRLARHEFGFDATRVLRASVDMTPRRRREITADEAIRLRRGVLERVVDVPGVRGVASVRSSGPKGLMVVGENGAAGERWINLRDYRTVSPAYLRTLGLPVIDGRDFADGDAAGQVPVAIVDQDAARRLWPEFASPVGRMLKLGEPSSDAPWVRVVGVTTPLGGQPTSQFSVVNDPDVYVVDPRDSMPPTGFVVATDTRDDPQLPLAIRRAIRTTVGESTWASVEPFRARFDELLRFTGFLAMLLCGLSAFALVLCAVGLYGVLAVTVNERLREIAIRIALGATVPSVARLVARDAAVVVLAGVGLGAFAALWATYGMAADLLDIRFAHAKALVAAEVVLLAVAAAAAWGPVRRGTLADPAHTLQAS